MEKWINIWLYFLEDWKNLGWQKPNCFSSYPSLTQFSPSFLPSAIFHPFLLCFLLIFMGKYKGYVQ